MFQTTNQYGMIYIDSQLQTQVGCCTSLFCDFRAESKGENPNYLRSRDAWRLDEFVARSTEPGLLAIFSALKYLV